MVMGLLAYGLDFTLWRSQQSKLQDAADSASLSGAISLGNGGRNVEKSAKAQAIHFAEEANEKALTGFESVAVVNPTEETVRVDLSVEVPRIFSGITLKENPTVRVSSTAKVVRDNVYCIYALNATASGAIDGNGNAVLRGDDCSIYAGSNSPTAITNSGTISADSIETVGGYSGTGYTPLPMTGAPRVTDPLESIQIPVPSTICDQSNFSTNSNIILTPGHYCGGLQVSGSSTVVTLEPGIYFLTNGDLKISGGGSVLGDGVVFVLSGSASIDISGRGKVATTPPIDGPLEGFSVAQHRSAPTGHTSKITGDGEFSFPGIVYLPRQALDIAGKAEGNSFTPSYAAIIADTIKISGSGELIATADTSSFSQVTSSRLSKVGARLIE